MANKKKPPESKDRAERKYGSGRAAPAAEVPAAPGSKLEQVERSHDELDHLLDSTGIPVVLLDEDLCVRRFTAAAKDVFALAADDVGRPLGEVPRKFRDPQLLDDLRAVLVNFRSVEKEITSESGRGYVRRILPYRAAEHEAAAVVIAFIEITPGKRAEAALRESEERHRLILDGVKDYAIFLLDTEGRIASWSASCARIFGYSADEALGEKLTLILPPELRDDSRLEGVLQRARQQGSVPEEGWHMHKSGRQFWASGNIAALKNEGRHPRGFVKVLRDNSERKAIIEQLERARSDAEAANTAKDHFLANISHELRTPLSAMLLWVKLLSRRDHFEPGRLREGLEAIEKAAKEQQALIEDLVDTARIVAGKLRLQLGEVALEPLCHSVVESLRPTAEEKSIAIDEVLDPAVGVVKADALRLQQVFSNLLSNAVKFTPPQGRISVRLRRHHDTVEFQVTDTGKGISPAFLPRIFERFSQSEAPEPGETGLGLGLSIARQLVELHFGEISAASPGAGQGATFTVRLPLPALKPRDAFPNRHREPPSLHGATVLMVEDDLETRHALDATLREAGATVVAVATVADAMREYRERVPDIILSDIGLGAVSGFDFIARIRAAEKGQKGGRLPAVALTAYADPKTRTKAIQSGFHEVLVKPIDPVDLLQTLAAMLALRRKS